jgi:hypothetical protein
MSAEPIDFKATLVEAIDETWRASAHPDPEDLERLRRGELEEERAEPLREHLLGCRECMTRWQSPEAFAGASAGELERAAFWRGLKPRLETRAGEPKRTSRTSAATRLQRFSPWLAAACLVAVAGLSAWVRTQQHELSRPRANAPIYDLDAAFEPRDGNTQELLEVPAGIGFTLVVTPNATTAAGPYELGIVDASGREVHTVRGLVPRPVDRTFSLWLPAGALAAGDYRLELRGGGRQPIESYRLRVAPDP